MIGGERVGARLADKADRRGLMAALDASQALVWFAPDGAVVDSNANLQEMLHYGPEEIKRLDYFRLVGDPVPPDPDAQLRWDRIAQGGVPNEERSYFTKSGQEVWTSASYAAIRNDTTGRTRRVFAILIDLSPWSWRPKDSAYPGGWG